MGRAKATNSIRILVLVNVDIVTIVKLQTSALVKLHAIEEFSV